MLGKISSPVGLSIIVTGCGGKWWVTIPGGI